MHTSSTQGDAREGNLILNIFFLAIKRRHAQQWGRERSACHVTLDMSYEREGACNATKIRVYGAEKKRKANKHE